MTYLDSARLICANSPLVHYARRPPEMLSPNDSGSTRCRIDYTLGTYRSSVHARVVEDPVTCVICAIGYMIWP